MKILSFIEIIILLITSNICSFLFAFLLQKFRTEALNKKIVKLERELMESNGETIREIKENVRLEGIIKNLINDTLTKKQLMN